MKKTIRLLSLILMLLVFNTMMGCGNKNGSTIQKKDIRASVWTQLSKSEQNEIVGTWKDGKIEKSIAKKDSNTFTLENKSLDGKKVYLITFKSKNEPTVGNVRKLVDIESGKIVGSALRD